MPKIVDHEQRRREIAEAVLRLVAREGIRGASLRSVAAETGCSTGMINHYCGDKQALLLTALREATRRVALRMASIQQLERGTERLRALLEAGMPVNDEQAANCRIFYHLATEGFTDPELATELANYYAWWRAYVRTAIEEAQKGGAFASFDAETLAESLVGLAEGLGIQALFDPEKMNPERLRRDLAVMIGQLGSIPEKTKETHFDDE